MRLYSSIYSLTFPHGHENGFHFMWQGISLIVFLGSGSWLRHYKEGVVSFIRWTIDHEFCKVGQHLTYYGMRCHVNFGLKRRYFIGH